MSQVSASGKAGVKLLRPGSAIRSGASLISKPAVVAPPVDEDNEYDIPMQGARAPSAASLSTDGTSGFGVAVLGRSKRRRQQSIEDEEIPFDEGSTGGKRGKSGGIAPSRGGQGLTQDDDDENEEAESAGASRGGAGAGAGSGRGAARGGDGVGAGALVQYAGPVHGSAGAGAGAGALVVPARPIAITKYGIRQFVESQHNLRLYLQNCVASCDMTCNPDLAHIATHARNAEYNPRRFSAVILRLQDPKCTALIFHSGKMVITGCKNEDDCLLAARKIAKILQKLGFNCAIKDFKIQNIVGTGDCCFPIRLEGLADEHVRFSSYEPELFPGLIYRLESPRLVVLVFVSGKIVLTGAKSRGALIEGLNKIYPILFKYRKAPSAGVGGGGGGGPGDSMKGAGAGAGKSRTGK